MKRLLLIPLLLLCTFLSVEAQQSHRFRIGVEYGTYSSAGEIDGRWEFRRIKSHYPSQTTILGDETATGKGETHFAGLKSEISVLNERVTLASGLRYTHVNERISPSVSSHLYLFHPSSGQGIELFRLYSMNESLGYLSIPLEADVLLWGRHSNWQGYAKGGIQAGMKLHGKTGIDFVTKEMEKHEDEILTAAGKTPSVFFANAYGGIGLRLILGNGIRLSAEIISPPLFLSRNNFSLLTTQSYGGPRFMISTPVNLFSRK